MEEMKVSSSSGERYQKGDPGTVNFFILEIAQSGSL